MTEGENMVERCGAVVKAKLFEMRHRTDTMGFGEIARAVIEALMEPTKPMVFFGMDAMARDDLEPTEDEFRAGFVAALRAALGEQFTALSQPNEGGEGK